MNDNVRVRFAPSPTGYLHVGGARSALFNYLFARRYGGKFLLRIEDTDRSRFVDDALQEIYESLTWLGINWDEGPKIGGDHGPYIQSERLSYYREYTEKLIASGHAYRCFCTADRLDNMRAAQEKNKTKIGYDRHCCSLTESEIQTLLSSNAPFVVRFKIPQLRTIRFNDMIRGVIEYQSDVLDDFILLKTDGFPTYHLANVVDDYLMKITHVLRGDEWIASTPRHVLLYESFGWNPPEFAHLPLILSADGGKLSKRKGAASVMDYKKGGILPETLINFLALLGWSPGENREKMTHDEMVSLFSIEQISPKASVFDEKKLEWMNGLYLAERPIESLVHECIPLFIESGYLSEASVDRDYLSRITELLRRRSKRLTDLVSSASYFFNDPGSYDEKAANNYFKPESANYLLYLEEQFRLSGDFCLNSLENLFVKAADSLGISIGSLIHPVRLAVSGVPAGPGLYELLEVLGKETVSRRVKKAIGFIKSIQD